MSIPLALDLCFIGLIFLIFTIIFAVRKEKACKLISGFNFFTEAQQAQYDKARLARDYFKLFRTLTIVVFAGAALCLVLGWSAFVAAIAILLFLVFRDFHINPEKAFEKYKLNP